MIKRILVGLGGTRFTPVAIKRAVELAEKHEAEITGVTAVDMLRIMKGVSGDDKGARRERQLECAEIIKQRIDESVSEFRRRVGTPDLRRLFRRWSPSVISHPTRNVAVQNHFNGARVITCSSFRA